MYRRERNANHRSCLQAFCAYLATHPEAILPDVISVQLFQKVIHSRSMSYSKTRNTLLKRGRHLKYRPFAFTEHGALMAATVLNSPRALIKEDALPYRTKRKATS